MVINESTYSTPSPSLFPPTHPWLLFYNWSIFLPILSTFPSFLTKIFYFYHLPFFIWSVCPNCLPSFLSSSFLDSLPFFLWSAFRSLPIFPLSIHYTCTTSSVIFFFFFRLFHLFCLHSSASFVHSFCCSSSFPVFSLFLFSATFPV